jgi:hypothetical protein
MRHIPPVRRAISFPTDGVKNTDVAAVTSDEVIAMPVVNVTRPLAR